MCSSTQGSKCDLGAQSPSWNNWYIGISSARAIFSSVETAGTVWPFSTRETVRFSMSPCDKSFDSRNDFKRSPITNVAS